MTASPKVLVSFNGTDGAQPIGGLYVDAAGDLFGGTENGGAGSAGTVFEIPNTQTGYPTTPTILFSLNGTNGQAPFSNLVADANGDLFGATLSGSTASNDGGTVFEVIATAGTYAATPTILAAFSNGYSPDGGAPLLDANGDLFVPMDSLSSSSSQIVEIANTASGYATAPTVLATFNSQTGTYLSGLIADSNGDLFGTANYGGVNAKGTVFELMNTASGYATSPTVLIAFNGQNGSFPVSGLIVDGAGDFFGTTSQGGPNGDGEVFEIPATPNGYATTPTILAAFNGSDGASPYGNLLMDAAGNLFGTTVVGGTSSEGTVFEIQKTGSTWATTPTVLANLNSTTGYRPNYDDLGVALTMDASGDLFGTAEAGGQYGHGTVFEIAGAAVVGPTIAGTVAGQTIAAQASISPFAAVAVADPNIGQTETVSVTLSAAANGTLSNLGSGSYNATTGVYTISGSSAAVSAALDALAFVPAAYVPPSVVNNADGSSYLYAYNPTGTVAETIADYSGSNGTGTEISDIVDNTDGTSLIYAYNPTSTVLLTSQRWSATAAAQVVSAAVTTFTIGVVDTEGLSTSDNKTTVAATTTATASDGAPAGNEISEVVDNTDGSSLVYAYNPSPTVTLTAQRWSGTNTANGAPAGNAVSDVVDNTDGTSLLYSYNPTSTVTQTASEYSATDSANGAPAGNELSDVVDNTDGTSILYAYNPTSTVSLTATYYSATTAGSGAPAGNVTSETFDYTNGESAITTYTNGVGTTVDYSGPNGTGSVIASIGGSELTSAIGSGTAVASQTDASGAATVAIAGSNQLIDPGTGNHTIQFLASATADTLVLHLSGSDRVTGFDASAGDTLDLSSLLAEAGVTIGADVSGLANYVSVTNANGAAAVVFDPTGQGGGSQVALLVGDGGLAAQLQTLKSFEV